MPGAKQTPGAGWWEVGSRHYKSKRALPSLQGPARQVLEIYFTEISSPAALPPASLPAQVYLQRGSYVSEHFLGAAMRPACHRCLFTSNLTSVDWSAWSVVVSIRFYSIVVELMPSHVVGKWLPLRCFPHRHPSDFKR